LSDQELEYRIQEAERAALGVGAGGTIGGLLIPQPGGAAVGTAAGITSLMYSHLASRLRDEKERRLQEGTWTLGQPSQGGPAGAAGAGAGAGASMTGVPGNVRGGGGIGAGGGGGGGGY
jgi:hypothetical protein